MRATRDRRPRALARSSLLLPGLLVVRAPWTAVPALSLAFWVLGGWPPVDRLPLAGRLVDRGRSSACGLARAAARAAEARGTAAPGLEGRIRAERRRPPRPRAPAARGAGRRSWCSLVALALVAPFPLWRHAPGPDMAFQTTAARLFALARRRPALRPSRCCRSRRSAPTRRRSPRSPRTCRGCPASTPPGRCCSCSLTAAGLLLVSLFALYATGPPPRSAALAAVVGLAVAPWPGFLRPGVRAGRSWPWPSASAAAALLLGHASRSSAVAAGLLLAASALGQPLLAGAIAAAAAVRILRRGRARIALALGVALVLALPAASPGPSPVAPRGESRSRLGGARRALRDGPRPRSSWPSPRPSRGVSRRWRGALVAVAAAIAPGLLVAARPRRGSPGASWPGSREPRSPASARPRPSLEAVCAPDGAARLGPRPRRPSGGRAGPLGPARVPGRVGRRASRQACGTRLESVVDTCA